jgi:hypothetical protein
MMVWRDLTATVCWVLLSLLGFPDTVPTHDGEGKQLTPEEYRDLAIEMECMYRKCKGNPHTKEAGRAILEAIQQTCKEFWSLKVRQDGFVGLGPLFCWVKKLASFYKYVEAGSGAILPNIMSPFRVWHKLWSAGVPVSEARLSTLTPPCYQGFPSPGLGVVDWGGVSPWRRLLWLPPAIGPSLMIRGQAPLGNAMPRRCWCWGFSLVWPLQLLVRLYCGSGSYPGFRLEHPKTHSCQHFGHSPQVSSDSDSP